MTKYLELKHIITITHQSKKQTIILNNEIYSIGRHSSNFIVINNSKISRYHCTILPVKYREREHQEVYWIIDGDLKGNRSSNGLFVNGNKCLSHELKIGDKIGIGGEDVILSYHVINNNSGEEIQLNKVDLFEEYSDDEIIQENFTDTLIGDESQSTLISSNKEEIVSVIEEILFTLNQQNKAKIHYPIFEINLDSKIVYSNDLFKQTFSKMRKEYENNVLLADLVNELQNSQQNIYFRKVKYQNQTFTQYAHYTENKTRIKSYLFESNERDKIETALRDSEEKYRAVVRQISEGIILIDPISKQIIEANTAYCALVGYGSQEILNLKLYDLVLVDTEIIDSIIRKIHQERLDLVQESIHRRKDDSLVNVEVSMSVIFYSAREVICYAVRDITERKISEERLRYHACHDLLTELANRHLFNEQLYKAIANAQRYKYQFAIIFIDLDRFKNINDTLGHDIGDKFLQGVANRLKSCIRSADLIARWGGDEFTILLSEIRENNDVAIVAQRILDSLKEPLQVLEYQLYASLSMGIAIYPQDGDSTDILLKNADIALYRMKEQGKGSYQYYSPHMNHKKSELLQMEGYLYDALKKQEFQLHYQPQINIKTGKITGMEALIRWHNPHLGRISPAHFIPIAEETGLINSIGEWVLYTACKQNKIWQDLGYYPFKVAVNLSARQFQQKNLVQVVETIIKQSNLEPQYLELEITETGIIQNPENAKSIINQLKNIGVSISLDDFGTGYSSLTYLKKFSFDKLKIDQYFVQELTADSEDIAIICALLTLGKGLNLQIVAEGVETIEQLKLLKELQCEEVQGYFFSRPLPEDEATNYIESANLHGISIYSL